MSFDLTVLGEETHNRGQVALQVTFHSGDEEVCRVVYKPRSSQTEIAILKLFKDLNNVHPLNNAKLPVYKIESLGDEGSIWEFVGEAHLAEDAGAKLAIIAKTDPKDYELAQANLHRLQTICEKIGVSDLHQENVILVKKVRWVPIDLEVIKHGHRTGLYGDEEEPAPLVLSAKENKLIKEFNQMQYFRVSRNVPIATHALSDKGKSSKGAEELAKSLYKVMSKEFIISIPYHELEKLVEQDIVNGDTPIFSEKEGVLYYGNQDYKIARTRS